MADELSEHDMVAMNSGLSAFEAKHFSRAIQILSPLAEQGIVEAMYRCAIIYQNGLGMHRNAELAERWMRRAAQQGHALAQHGLGFMYMEGDCLEKNGALAVQWFTRAAEQGLLGSQTTLAMIYRQGELVDKDEELARYWYQRAGFDTAAEKKE